MEEEHRRRQLARKEKRTEMLKVEKERTIKDSRVIANTTACLRDRLRYVFSACVRWYLQKKKRLLFISMFFDLSGGASHRTRSTRRPWRLLCNCASSGVLVLQCSTSLPGWNPTFFSGELWTYSAHLSNVRRNFCPINFHSLLSSWRNQLPAFMFDFFFKFLDLDGYPSITYHWTCLLILDHSYLVGNLTNSTIAETKASEPLKSWHFCISNFRTC